MKYKFSIDGKIREFWYNNISRLDGAEGTMEELIPNVVHDENNPPVYLGCYRNQDKDLYFTLPDGTQVLCKDAITLTPEEFIRHAYEEYDAPEMMNDMMRTMQKYGIGCIRFRINQDPLQYEGWAVDELGRGVQKFRTNTRKFRECGSKYEPAWVEFEAHAEYNRMPEDNHKLRLYAVKDPDNHGTHDFYTSDLNRMWIARPDYMQLTLGQQGTPTGIYGKQSDSDYLRSLREQEDHSNLFDA